MNTDINTNVRLFDLVRYMRSELHEAELITDAEYAWICAEAPMAKGQGSPSPRRLEDYDEVKAREIQLQLDVRGLLLAVRSDENHLGILTKSAISGILKCHPGLDSENDKLMDPERASKPN